MEKIVVLSTAPNKEEAKKIANVLVKEKLAACVNIVDNVLSIYEWKNEICEDNEVLMVIKTKKNRFKELEKRVKELHSYEVPEIIALDITNVSKEYLEWMDETLK